MVADPPYRLAFVFRPFATLSPLATLIPRRSAAFTIFLRAVSFLVPDSKSVWLNRAMALRTWASSLIGRCPSPSLSTYANLRLSIFSRSFVSSSPIGTPFSFLSGEPCTHCSACSIAATTARPKPSVRAGVPPAPDTGAGCPSRGGPRSRRRAPLDRRAISEATRQKTRPCLGAPIRHRDIRRAHRDRRRRSVARPCDARSDGIRRRAREDDQPDRAPAPSGPPLRRPAQGGDQGDARGEAPRRDDRRRAEPTRSFPSGIA